MGMCKRRVVPVMLGVCACVGRNGQQKAAAPTTRFSCRPYRHKCCTACRDSGGGRPGCAVSSSGSVLGSASTLKLRCGGGIAIAWLGAVAAESAAHRLTRTHAAHRSAAVRAQAGKCVQRLGKRVPARACARTGDSRKGTFTTCRARRCVAMRRRCAFEYFHGVLGLLTWGTFHSRWGTLHTGQGYSTYWPGVRWVRKPAVCGSALVSSTASTVGGSCGGASAPAVGDF